MTEADLIGTREAAAIIGESVKNTLRRVDSGQLPAVIKLPGIRGAYLFNRSDVEAVASGDVA